MKPDPSPDEFMQAVIPGSKTFPVRLLCPKCGWHFKHGLTDVHGKHGKLVPDIALVCGQCLSFIRTNDKLEFEAMSEQEIKELDDETRAGLYASWQVAYMALLLVGPEPKGTAQ